MTRASSLLIDTVYDVIQDRILPEIASKVNIVIKKTDQDATLLGAALMGWDYIMDMLLAF